MRQPEVARVSALLVAALLVVPVAQAGWSTLVAGAFLVEFLSQGRLAALSTLTSAPTRGALAVPGAEVDRYLPRGLRRGRPLVLVHGFTPAGKNDARARAAAELLARAGFDVAVPTLPGLTRGRLRAADVDAVVATLAARREPTVVLGVSVGAGPALVAAADASVRDRVRVVVSLGGYASAFAVLTFWLTGRYEYGEARGSGVPDPALVRTFVGANADLLGPSAFTELESADPERAARVLAGLSPELRGYLDTLSPLRVARQIRGHLVLIHAYRDQAIPYTESLRLAAARPEQTLLLLVGVLDHVDGARRTGWRDARDVLALWRVVYALIAGSRAGG